MGIFGLAVVSGLWFGSSLGHWIQSHPSVFLARIHPAWVGGAMFIVGNSLPGLYNGLVRSALATGDVARARAIVHAAYAAGVFLVFAVPMLWSVLLGKLWLIIGLLVACTLAGAATRAAARL